MRIIARMNVGGPAVQIAGLMRGLPESEFDQRLFTGFCDPGEADFLNSQAPDVLAMRIPGLGRSLRPSEDLKALLSLMREMRHFRPDIIHTHTAKAGVLGRVAGQLSGINPLMVHTYHGHLLHGYFPPTKTNAVIAVERALAKITDRLVAVGSRVRDDLLAAHIGVPRQFVVIPPGLSLPPLRTKDHARESLNLPSDVPVIGFIGRLTNIKRPDRFAEVVRLVHRKRPETQFVVAGDGDQAASLRSLVSNLPVTMLGWRSDVETVLAACDAVILTSDNEGTPLSLIQAGLAGIPVVASNVGSVSDVVIDGETGWLTRPNATDLASVLLQLMSDPAEASRRGRAALHRSVKDFGSKRLAEDHAAVYREVIGSR